MRYHLPLCSSSLKKLVGYQFLVCENLESQQPVQPVQQASLTPEECLAQLDIRVGRIVKAWNHPDSEK